ncbi:MBL fold metallo-hydrolase [Oryzibacter oryziterrae]|uniref:MBL fold metallo-hydrolase n=1 Tax=Oryzibacter oryziterrae TaxID=2766474 RepID=UPI001F302D50|nr:MBL fold metallo-hydrolase [Oryzibacter oryziterrae]
MDSSVHIAFHGVRGSRPVSGADFSAYGGATSCVSLRLGDEMVVLDLGTGAPSLGRQIALAPPEHLTVLIGHAHYDHVAGLPFFQPLRTGAKDVVLASAVAGGTRRMVAGLMAAPFFPVGPEVLAPTLDCVDLRPGRRFRPSPSIEVNLVDSNHPGGCTAFRVELGGRSVLYALDHQAGDPRLDAQLIDLGRGVDLAILDAGEPIGARQSGIGHSTWQEAVSLGMRMGAAKIALAHHAPASDDPALDWLGAELADVADNAFLAREGQDVQFEAVCETALRWGTYHAGL